jgi:hypothetical protein
VKKSPAYIALLALSFLLSAAAVLTLLPSNGASYPNLLGYKSICTFAPAATLLCAFLAGVTCTIRARLVAPRSRAVKSPALPFLVLIILLAAALAFVPSYVRWKVDEVTSATVYQE